MTVALAVLAGVHCSAPPYSGAVVDNEQPATTAGEKTPQPGAASPTSTQENEEDPRWALEAEGLPATLFTTTARGEDGALYAAGTFDGSLTIGNDTVTSKGADDVVLVRLDASGQITWVKSIGSTRSEHGPKVTFVDGSVRILAETEGQVDCGSGEMGKWSSGMFFYCLYSPEGNALGGGTFPTGAP